MSEASKEVLDLIRGWGFASAPDTQLIEHAENVLKLKGRSVGEIIAGLGIATKESIDETLRLKTSKAKTIDYLIDSGFRELSGMSDKVLSIQSGDAYIWRTIPQLVLHSHFAKKEHFRTVEGELTRWGMLPMMCGGNLILMFEDHNKLMQFKGQGKAERMNSPLFQTLAEITGSRPENINPLTMLARNSVHLEYRQKFSDTSTNKNAEDALQTIYQSESEDDPAIATIVRILNEALSQGINDVAIIPDRKTGMGLVYFRKYQRLMNSKITLSAKDRNAVTMILMARSRANPSGGKLQHPADGNANFEGKSGQAFLRMNFIPLEESQFPSTSVSIRVLPRTTKSISLADLNIDPDLQTELRYFSERKYGLFVVCGPTGSGKSTTIAGMLCEHERIYGETLKRMSVEQPVERVLPGVLHIDVSQHRYQEGERSKDNDNFGMALRAILRHDPDAIFVGEVRDKESCQVSVDSANTGHLVFTTTHANDPVLGYRRMAAFLDKDRCFDLVNVLQGILAQRLVTTVCEHCCESMILDDDDIASLSRYCAQNGIDLSQYALPETYKKANPKGCEHCLGGYAGMVPIHGLLSMNPKVRELLLSSSEKDWMQAQAASDSKFTLFGSAFKLFLRGQIDLKTLML